MLYRAFCACLAAHGQNFGDWFTDRTLRVDYVFTGDYQHQDICLDELSSLLSGPDAATI